eukprot:TRINITY_DN2061_c0_g2_i1.p1 TRINITY_DN2061_c0_g2~~TRINITY_DN2061_c0_g2_i1.p1  ORF type:complete len:485 (-),score=126.29 TRINITY_DN2061_c0_g2_i1:57-1511(-)
MKRLLALIITLVVLNLLQVEGVTYNITASSTNWITTLSSLQAGDTAILQAGTYTKTAKLTLRLNGTPSAPILITGNPSGPKPIINHSGSNQNIIDLVEGNYFTIQYLELTGGSLGLRLGPSPTYSLSNGVIQNLTVHDTPETAISANFPNHTFTNLTFKYNEIYNTGSGTGECLYLGCVGGSCIIRDSVISNNLLHDTLLATTGSVGSAIQVKEYSFNNLIQDNVCYNLGGPCVLIYTDGGRGRNTVIGNTMLGGLDNGIQAAAGATIINNIVLNTRGDGIAIIQNPPGVTIGNITILHNTVVNASDGYCLRATNFNSGGSFLIANNAFVCPGSNAVYVNNAQNGVGWYNNGFIGGSAPAGVMNGSFYGMGSILSELPGIGSFNVYPAAGSTLIARGNGSVSVGYDFNYMSRDATRPTVGAYEYSTASNPGWVVGRSFKQMNGGGVVVPSNSPTPGNSQNPPTTTSGGTSGAANRICSWFNYWL